LFIHLGYPYINTVFGKLEWVSDETTDIDKNMHVKFLDKPNLHARGKVEV